MTVKSPFYNKPSTATSVDSVHKCPLTSQANVRDASIVPTFDCEKQDQRAPAGFENVQATSPSNSNRVADPCGSSAAKSDMGSLLVTTCSNCGTTSTPLWRRSPQGETICNACGLYLKARNISRPQWLNRDAPEHPPSALPVPLAPVPTTGPPSLIAAPAATLPLVKASMGAPSQCPSSGEKDCQHQSTISCTNCCATATPLWRRDEQGNTMCNACGLYYKLHHVHRPLAMKRAVIKRRKRMTAASLAAQYPRPTDHSYRRVAASPDGQKPKLSLDHEPPVKRTTRPILPVKTLVRPLLPHRPTVEMMPAAWPNKAPVEPKPLHPAIYVPSLPLKPTSSKAPGIAHLLNPTPLDGHSHPERPLSISATLPHSALPLSDTRSSSTTATAVARATVSNLLNQTISPQQTQQILEAHRHELQREVTHLTTLLSQTTVILQNLDHAMAMTTQAPKICA